MSWSLSYFLITFFSRTPNPTSKLVVQSESFLKRTKKIELVPWLVIDMNALKCLSSGQATDRVTRLLFVPFLRPGMVLLSLLSRMDRGFMFQYDDSWGYDFVQFFQTIDSSFFFNDSLASVRKIQLRQSPRLNRRYTSLDVDDFTLFSYMQYFNHLPIMSSGHDSHMDLIDDVHNLSKNVMFPTACITIRFCEWNIGPSLHFCERELWKSLKTSWVSEV